MGTATTTAMRRFASTIFVFLALFVACAGVSAAPCGSDMALQEYAAQHVLDSHDIAGVDDQDLIPSLEDNGGGLDDTFDVPPEHVVIVLRSVTGRPAGLVAPPHAHHPSLDLRPPIA